MPLVSRGFLGVWAGRRASPAQTLIGPDPRMARGGLEPPTPPARRQKTRMEENSRVANANARMPLLARRPGGPHQRRSGPDPAAGQVRPTASLRWMSMPSVASRRALRPGLDRPQTQYAWPQSLLKSKGDKPLVYLDMNHWIYLAQAATGHANGGRYQQALDALRQAAERVAIPLASVHYMEIEGNRDARQRSDLATLLEELSGFVCVLPRSSIAQVELDAALAQLLGTLSRFTNAPLLGWTSCKPSAGVAA